MLKSVAPHTLTLPQLINCVGLFLLVVFACLATQKQLCAQDTYRFRHLQKNEGLSSDDVLCMTQDQYGYLWIGTQNGLNRYDGYQFNIFKNIEGDSLSLSSNWINDIIEDENGILWIATQGGGLNKYNRKTEEFTRYQHEEGNPNSLSDNEIWQLELNGKNSIWVGTVNGGLNLFDISTEQFTSWTKSNSKIQSNEIVSLASDGHNRVWMASMGGGTMHFNFDTKKFSFLPQDFYAGKPGSRYVRTLARNNKNELWIAASRSLHKLNLKTNKAEHWKVGKETQVGIHSRYMKSILLDSRGGIWIGTKDFGLYRYNRTQKRFQNYRHLDGDKYSLAHNDVTCVFEDDSGLIWVGTRGGGLNILNYRDMDFEHWTHLQENSNSLIFKEVRAVYEDKKKNIWLGTNLGISKFNLKENRFENFFNDKVNSNQNRIRAFAEVGDEILIGTEGFGLLVYNQNTKQYQNERIQTKTLTSRSQYVRALLQTNDSSLWVGSYGGGLLRLDPITRKVKNHYIPSKHPDSLKTLRVQVLCKKNKQELWVGSNDGLFLFNATTQKFKHWTKIEGQNNSLSGDKIRALYQDSTGVLWVGTRRGITKFNPATNSFTRFSTDDGLPSEIIFGIMEDRHKNLWLTTPNGLSKVNMKTEKFQNTHISQNNKLDMGGHCLLSDGRMVAAGKNGFVIFHPDSITINPHVPNIVFTSFLVDNKPVPFYNYDTETYEIELAHHQNDFTLTFSAFDFTEPHKNQYAYFLEGPNGKKRVDLGNRRELSFSNVEHGQYTLRVIGSNNDGLWNTQGESISILIHPPWWKTLIFKIILSITVIVCLVSFYLYRMASIKTKNIELERLVKIRTHELEERQKEILVQNEEIKQQSEEILSQRDHLAQKNNEIEGAYNSIQLLSQFGQQLTSTFSIEEIHDMIYSYINESIKLDAFGVGVYRPEKQIIEYFSFYEKNVRKEYFTRKLNTSNSFSSLAISTKEAIFENKVSENWPRYFEHPPTIHASIGAESILAVPLTSEGKVFGVMTAYALSKNAFSPKTHSFLNGVASYISIALSNARLYGEVNRKNEHINSSIRYAQQIQQSILPIKSNVDKLVDSFILFMPKDIVSGDFYQFAPISQADEAMDAIFAVVDCTGHGVPGAFMSLIGNRIINQIINERNIYQPAEILEELNHMLIKALKQDQTDNNDGMDVSMCRLTESPEGIRVQYAGAKRPLIIVDKNGKLSTAGGTRKSIGGARAKRRQIAFEQKEFVLEKGTTLYLTSDGFVDQNCNSGKRFGSKALFPLLQEASHLNTTEQHDKLLRTIKDFMGQVAQRDDITIWGIRL